MIVNQVVLIENCLYLGTTTTGTLNNATDNIAVSLNALNRLTTGIIILLLDIMR